MVRNPSFQTEKWREIYEINIKRKKLLKIDSRSPAWSSAMLSSVLTFSRWSSSGSADRLVSAPGGNSSRYWLPKISEADSISCWQTCATLLQSPSISAAPVRCGGHSRF